MQQAMQHILGVGIDYCGWLFEAIDNCSIGALVVLFFACRLMLARINGWSVNIVPGCLSGIFLFAYMIHTIAIHRDEFELIVVGFVRAVLCFEAVYSILAVVVAGLIQLLCWLIRRWLWIRVFLANRALLIEQRRNRRRAMEEIKRLMSLPRPKPVPRSERLKAAVKQAQEEYEAEIESLKNATLDAAERKVMEMYAKQRLIAKLKDFQNG